MKKREPDILKPVLAHLNSYYSVATKQHEYWDHEGISARVMAGRHKAI